MKVLSALGASVKSAIKSLPFSSYGGYGYGLGGMSGGYLPGISLTGGGFMGGNLPGTNFDYRTAAGVLWENPSAAACFVALTKAFAQARPYLENHNGTEWEKVETHPLTDLLNAPNKFYSGKRLFGVTLVSTLANEAAFWRFERNGAGDVAEIWFEPPVGVGATGIAPAWDSTEFIKEYYYFVDGKRVPQPIPIEDVVYFRHGLNPSNARLPWSPLNLGSREIATLNGASTYTAALMKNSAVPSGMISLDGSALASGTAPSPEQAETMKQKVKAGFKGDNVGEPFVSSLPWKWTPFNWSPADVNIDAIRQWPQGQICALLATPEIVALLPTGQQPTYENLSAAMQWWWDNTIIPLEDAFADEIETQMFGAFDLDPKEYRLAWDRSEVRALQEDEIAKSKMIDDSYTSGVIDLYEAQMKRGIPDVPEEYKGRFHPSATAGDPQAAPVTPEEAANQERLNKAVSAKAWEESEHPRDSDGKFGSGGGISGNNNAGNNKKPDISFATPSDDPQRWNNLSKKWKNETPEDGHEVMYKGFRIQWYPWVRESQPLNRKDDGVDGEIIVKDSDNNVVGETFMATLDGKTEGVVQVHPDERRKGLASQMYEMGEKMTGKKFTPAEEHTPLAEAMWNGKNRRFGETTKADDQHAQRMEAELKAAPPLPEDNPDPFGMAFTQEEIDKLTDIDEASVKAAFANATPEMRALLSTRQIDTNDAETPER